MKKEITPITYYGGKQYLAKIIAPIVNMAKASCYVEPFCGGAAVLFAIDKHQVEAINDHNNNVHAFWNSLKNKPNELIDLCEKRALYSERFYHLAKGIVKKNSGITDDIERGWAFFYLSRTSFGSNMGSGLSWDTKRNVTGRLTNRIATLNIVANRISQVCIHEQDALEIINKYDREQTIFYIDPPYVGANQGCYSGYKKENLLELMERLRDLEGFFVLSGYSSNGLMDSFGAERGHFLTKVESNVKFNENKTKSIEYIITNFKHANESIFH